MDLFSNENIAGGILGGINFWAGYFIGRWFLRREQRREAERRWGPIHRKQQEITAKQRKANINEQQH